MHGNDILLYIQFVSRTVSILYLYIATTMLMYTRWPYWAQHWEK